MQSSKLWSWYSLSTTSFMYQAHSFIVNNVFCKTKKKFYKQSLEKNVLLQNLWKKYIREKFQLQKYLFHFKLEDYFFNFVIFIAFSFLPVLWRIHISLIQQLKKNIFFEFRWELYFLFSLKCIMFTASVH